LAEAEVEYADRSETSIFVAFPFADKPALARAYSTEKLTDGALIIWTTTPWTIPANQALNLHPEHDYALVELQGEHGFGKQIIIAHELVESCLEESNLEGYVIASTPGSQFERITLQLPLATADAGYDCLVPV